MTNSAHTPGPWLYTSVSDGSYSVHRADTAPAPIAHDIQSEKDARLIAAAPELLAVAHLALDHLDGQEYLQACAIIAKATGG